MEHPSSLTRQRYGIEGIAQTYEDPFGVAKIDINMDDIVEDARKEVEVMLMAWQTQGEGNSGIFRPRLGGTLDTPKSDDSGEIYTGETNIRYGEEAGISTIRFMVSGARDRQSSAYSDDYPVEIKATRASRLSAVSPAENPHGGSSYLEPV
jgi:putative membrane protein